MNSLLESLTRQRSSLHRSRVAEWKRAPGELPHVLGHRGARHAEPENTLRAFDRALVEGARGVELDVRMTADGELIVVHDPEWVPASASQGAGASQEEGALPRVGAPQEARPLREGDAPREASFPDATPTKIPFDRLSASQVAALELAGGERIPTLAQVLDWQRDTGAWLNVELKGDVPSQGHVVRAACSLIAAHGGDRILISSFYPRMVAECALRLPDVPICWLVHAGQRYLKNAWGWEFTGAAGVHPEHVDLSGTRLAQWLAAGAVVNVWTVNDGDTARRLAALGVDGLISDCPGLVLEALRRP